MASVEAQVKPEFVNQYPALEAGHWYVVNQGARELDSDQASAVHLEADNRLVEVDTSHVVRRKVGEEE
jgi:hypothetical protein